jgi:hypothetical protein
MPSRRSRTTITKRFNYDERVEAEEKRKSSNKKRGRAAQQPGRQKQKALKNNMTGEAMSAPAPAPAPAIDDISMAPNDSSQELKNMHPEQECSISAQHENSKMDDIPSPTVEFTITPPKTGRQKQKTRMNMTREAISAPASATAIDDTSTAPNDSSQELKNLHLEQECSTSAHHEDSKMDDIPSPAAEVTITPPKTGRQKQKPRMNMTREAMPAPASATAIDDTSTAPNDSSQELKNMHPEQECSISAQHENSKMDDIPSPTVEFTIISPKKHQRSSGPIKKRKHEDSRDNEPWTSATPRGFEVELTKIQEEELSSGRAAYFSDMYKSSDDSDSSDDEAEMRRTEKRFTRKKPRRSRQTVNGGGPRRSSVATRVSASSGDYSSADECSIPTLQTDADRSGRTVQSSKKSDSATEMKSDSATESKWSTVALTSGAMDSLMQALQYDVGKTVCSFESNGGNNLHLLVNASSVLTGEGCDC